MKVKMIAMSAVAAMAFSGCSVIGTQVEIGKKLESWDNAVAKKLDEYMPDKVFGKLAKDEIDPKIRDTDDNHFKLDPFFAMPNANSEEEAKEQVDALYEAARYIFSELGHSAATNKKMNYKWRNTCAVSNFHAQRNGHGVLFFRGKSIEMNDCNAVHKLEFSTLTLKPVKLDNTWYLVVSSTNVKNRGFVGSFFNILKNAAQDNLNSTEPRSNAFIATGANAGIFKAMKRNPELSENFVNVQNCSGTVHDKNNLCPNDPREAEYRKKFQEAIKAAGL